MDRTRGRYGGGGRPRRPPLRGESRYRGTLEGYHPETGVIAAAKTAH